MISSLLSREININTNVLWIPSDDKDFEKFFRTLQVSVFTLDQIYLGSFVPDIIISNEKTKHIDKIIKLTKYHQCPLVFIDHEEKSDMIDISKFQDKISELPIVKLIAFSEQIKKSWGDIHDLVLNDTSGLQEWQDFTNKTKKIIYKYE
jgi:hypothetical protein